MTKWLVLMVALAGCGKSDKCSAMYDKVAPAMKDELKGEAMPDRETMVGKCRETMKRKPEMEKSIDCMLAISGTPTKDQLAACEGMVLTRTKGMTEAELQLDKLSKVAKLAFGESNAFPSAR